MGSSLLGTGNLRRSSALCQPHRPARVGWQPARERWHRRVPPVTSVRAHGHRSALLTPAHARGLSVPWLGFPEGLADPYWGAMNFQR